LKRGNNHSPKIVQGRFYALVLFLGINSILVSYSAIVGFSDSLAFVKKTKKLTPVSGLLGQVAQCLPSDQSFGYFAPQVCSEFRLLARVGSSRTKEVKDVEIKLGAEAEMLISSLSNQAQEDDGAKAIAKSFALYALRKHPKFDYADVRIQAEWTPPIAEAKTRKPAWETVQEFYFTKEQ
jgi:hypothetical protein